MAFRSQFRQTDALVWILVGFVLYQPLLHGCETNWKEFGDLCYTIILYPNPPGGTIIDARIECRKVGADLITIKTIDHQKFIEDLFYGENGTTPVHRDVYIAAGDAISEAVYQWFDGTPVTFSNWKASAGEPDNHGPNGIPENCVRIKSGYKRSTGKIVKSRLGLWSTVPCLEPAKRVDGVLCQKPTTISNGRRRFFHGLTDVYFGGHEIAAHSASGLFKCISYCLDDYRCVSFNWNESMQSVNCVLNNATRFEDNEAFILNVTAELNPAEWDYYETIYPIYGN